MYCMNALVYFKREYVQYNFIINVLAVVLKLSIFWRFGNLICSFEMCQKC